MGKNEFKWGNEQKTSFQEMKRVMTSTPVLAYPLNEGRFILDTDASDCAVAAELLQEQGGKERVISYASASLTYEQRRYCTTRKEVLAIVRFTRQFRHYLLGRPVLLRTDHNSLTWLMRFRHAEGQLAR